MIDRTALAPRTAFPDGFLLGCASAAHQIEGGLDNDWTRMESGVPGAIHDGSVSGAACDSWNRWRDDLRICAEELHNNGHRFSVEWSRIEPHEGVFNHEALRHYAEMARTCREMGMEPVVTLHHFTLPLWLADQGGVIAPSAPRVFARFAAAVAEALGEHVTWWVTINEPSVYAVLSHMFGAFPPQRTSFRECLAACEGLLRMHAGAAAAIRAVARRRGWDPRISIAHHERRLLPARRWSPLDRAAALMPDFLFNRWFLRSCAAGRNLPPVGHGERVPGLGGSLDYLGLNYYTEELMTFDLHAAATTFGRPTPIPGLPRDTFGNTIDAQGLRRGIDALWSEFGLPIMITENGVADGDDELRGDYIRDHLAVVLDALSSGVDVRGYFHWTQLDNFEWAEGYAQKFGLYAVDRDTMERTAKPSARVYGAICAARAISPREAAGRGV